MIQHNDGTDNDDALSSSITSPTKIIPSSVIKLRCYKVMKKNINNRMKYSKTETKKMKNMNKTLKGSANVHFQDGTKTKTAIRRGVLTGGMTTDARNDDASSPKSLDNGRMEDDTYYDNDNEVKVILHDMDDDIRDGIVSMKQIIEQHPQPNKQHHHHHRGTSVDDDRTRSRDDDDFTFSSTYDDDSTNFGIEEGAGTFEDFVKQWDEESTHIDAGNIGAVTDALAIAVSYEDFVKNTVTDALVTTVGCDEKSLVADDDHDDDKAAATTAIEVTLRNTTSTTTCYKNKAQKNFPIFQKATGLNLKDVDIAITSPRKIAYIEETLRSMEEGSLKTRTRSLGSEKSLERTVLTQSTVSPTNLSSSSYNEQRRIKHNNNKSNNIINIGNSNGKIDIKTSTTTIGMDHIVVRNPFFLLASSSSSSSNYSSESNNDNHTTNNTEDVAAATTVGVGSNDDNDSNNNNNEDEDDEDEEDDNLRTNNNDVSNIAVGSPTSSSSSSSITDTATGAVDSLGSSIETNRNNNNNSISHGGSAESQIREKAEEEVKIVVEIYPRKQRVRAASPPATTTTTEKSKSSSSPRKRNNKKRWWSRKNRLISLWKNDSHCLMENKNKVPKKEENAQISEATQPARSWIEQSTMTV
ncbi:hypothetical protein FRACYDRAFT_255350 [Fragilariopsis cylindrus CCMP1102]|uniref:Uncharacterized protein n=1 Tax=Fragilariopsis cylindrus CCMP1102 TaxID=635003 RepID=A0A1E7EK95_9STRA|nr:hypothetical protein FRACYDRAFT_255350 [Fragilariopsis cylindrus CCMP1102]|eukprot:OEU06298.1 hypothetical protein FRACYDRAFT_255350 [Fragilariopsis cylindrus CCMP1102]